MNVDFFIGSCQTELCVSKVKNLCVCVCVCVRGGKGEKSKDCLTVLFAANMDGSEKIISLVNRKFLKSQCMKNCKSLPLFHDSNS